MYADLFRFRIISGYCKNPISVTALYTGRVRIPLPYNFRILRVSAVSFACGEDVGSTVDTLEWQYMANSELKLNTCLAFGKSITPCIL